jgi:hypothetical protein
LSQLDYNKLYFSNKNINQFTKEIKDKVNDNIIITKNYKLLEKMINLYNYNLQNNNYLDIILYNYLKINNIEYDLLNIDYKLIVSKIINDYVTYLSEIKIKFKINKIIIQGVPAPNYLKDELNKEGEVIEFLNMIKYYNCYLEGILKKYNFHFLDIYSYTVGIDGKSNRKWHLDAHHISPDFYFHNYS